MVEKELHGNMKYSWLSSFEQARLNQWANTPRQAKQHVYDWRNQRIKVKGGSLYGAVCISDVKSHSWCHSTVSFSTYNTPKSHLLGIEGFV